jgi:hypothetical protein
MRKLIIPIVPETQAMLAEVNGGVTPEVEDELTFFVYNGPGETADIINRYELRSIRDGIMLNMYFKN